MRITIYTLWEMEGATIYIGGIDCNTRREVVDYTPCLIYRRMIINSGINRVVVQTADGFMDLGLS